MLLTHQINRKQIVIVLVVILIVVVIIETYAHFYVQVNLLPVITTEDALSTPYLFNNSSNVYSVNGAEWLLVLSYWRNNSDHSGLVNVYTFKLQDNSSFPIQSLNIKPLSLTFKTDHSDINDYGSNSFSQALYLNKGTIATKDFFTPAMGRYEADISFTFRVYQETLFGYIPGQEATVHFNATFIYP